MGSRPSVFRAPAVAELSRISVFGCAGAGTGVGAADFSDPFGVVERVDEGAEDGEDAVPGVAVLAEPGCGGFFDDGNWLPAWAKVQPREELLEPSLEQCWRWACLPERRKGIPEADLGSAEGWV